MIICRSTHTIKYAMTHDATMIADHDRSRYGLENVASTYSGSKNCSSVCLFWKDCIGTETDIIHGSDFLVIKKKNNILASQNILDHVI